MTNDRFEISTDLHNFLLMKQYSDTTLYNYIVQLQRLPVDPDFHSDFLAKNRSRMLYFAYRAYLEYRLFNEEITELEHMKLKRKFRPPRQKPNVKEKWNIPESDWSSFIRRAPNFSCQFAIWLGFRKGPRLNELLHLRKQDFEFTEDGKGLLLIQEHKKSKRWEKFTAKRHSYRKIPLNRLEVLQIKKHISYIEKKFNLDHDYIIISPQTLYKPANRTFGFWLKKIDERLHAHALRYSFATWFYYKSNHDIYLTSRILGHKDIEVTRKYLNLDEKEFHSKASAVMN